MAQDARPARTMADPFKVVEKWSAKRSGPHMTVFGEQDGVAVRFAAVSIELRKYSPFAIDLAGNAYELAGFGGEYR